MPILFEEVKFRTRKSFKVAKRGWTGWLEEI